MRMSFYFQCVFHLYKFEAILDDMLWSPIIEGVHLKDYVYVPYVISLCVCVLEILII